MGNVNRPELKIVRRVAEASGIDMMPGEILIRMDQILLSGQALNRDHAFLLAVQEQLGAYLELKPDEIEILKVVRTLERQNIKPFSRNVAVACQFKVSCEAIRQKLVSLWQRGWLHRPGGANARRGYRSTKIIAYPHFDVRYSA
ncbi:MAG: hypothetical protein ACPG7F_00110 [Aggregatilineales bacterium]